MSHIFEILVSPGFSHPCISPLAPIWNGARVGVFFGLVDTLFLCLLPCCLYFVLDGHSYPQREGFWSSMSLRFSYGHSFQSSGPEDGFMKGLFGRVGAVFPGGWRLARGEGRGCCFRSDFVGEENFQISYLCMKIRLEETMSWEWRRTNLRKKWRK